MRPDICPLTLIFAPLFCSLSNPHHITLPNPNNYAHDGTNCPIEVPLLNYEKGTYYGITISLGTPEQQMILQLDTGSSDITVLSRGSSLCENNTFSVCDPENIYGVGDMGSYSSLDSSTYKYLSDRFKAYYGIAPDMQVQSGYYVKDRMQLGGVDVGNVTLGLLESIRHVDGREWEGIVNGVLGLGYESGQTGVIYNTNDMYPSWLRRLKEEGVIHAMVYGVFLNDRNEPAGSLLIGGIDNSKYTGDMATIPFIPTPPTNIVNRTLIPWTSLSYKAASTKPVDFQVNMAMLVDTGASYLVLPNALADSILQGLGVDISDPNNLISCDIANTDANFTFGFNNDPQTRIVMPLSSIIRLKRVHDDPREHPVVDTQSKSICYVAISRTNDRYGILGTPFLGSAYAVFDLENDVLGLAQIKLHLGDLKEECIDRQSGFGTATVTATANVETVLVEAADVQSEDAQFPITVATTSLKMVSPTFEMGLQKTSNPVPTSEPMAKRSEFSATLLIETIIWFKSVLSSVLLIL